MRVSEIAKQEDVSVQTVRNWIKSGILKASVDTMGFFIEPSDLEECRKRYSKTSINLRTRRIPSI